MDNTIAEDKSHVKVTYMHYYLKPIKILDVITPMVTISAKIETNTLNNKSILYFGFGRLKKGDTFDRKYGKDLTVYRALNDPTLVIGFKGFKPQYFNDIATKMGEEVAFFTPLGQSLISPLQLPRKQKKVYSIEEIEELRRKSLEQKQLKASETTNQDQETDTGAANE